MHDNLRSELEKLGIYQLRMYAREVGVKLATTLKKADLIDAVMRVLNGETQPYIKTTKKGRPPKDIVHFSPTTGVLTEEVYYSNKYDYGYQGLFSKGFTHESKGDEELVEVSGLIDLLGNGFGMIVSTNGRGRYSYVTEELVAKFAISRGDMVVAKAYSIGDEFPLIVQEIVTVNGFDAFDLDSRNLKEEAVVSEPMEICEASNELAKIFKLSNISICKGDRILIAGQDRRILPLATFNFTSIMNQVKDLEIVMVMVNVNNDYRKAYESLDNVTCIGADFCEENELQLKLVELGLRYASNLSKCKNKNVLCIVQDLDEIANAALENGSLQMLKKFYISAFNSMSGSLTIAYGVDAQSENFNQFITNENVYMKTCEVGDARQLVFKFNWAGSGRNDLVQLMPNDNGYSYLLSSFLRRGNYIEMQKQIEDWVISGLNKDEIIEKMKNEITK